MIMGIRSWPRRIKDSIELEGLWGFASRAASARFYRLGILNAEPLLARTIPPPAPSLTARSAAEEDMDALVALLPHRYSPGMLRERLAKGERCFLSFLDGDLAFVGWVGEKEAHLDYGGLSFPLHKEEIYGYEWYTRPEYRRQGADNAAWRFIQEYYSERGVSLAFGFVSGRRKPFGPDSPHKVAIIRIFRLGPLKRFWVETYGPQAEYWRERLRELRWERHSCVLRGRV